VRLGAHAGGTRVVLDLGATAARRVFYLPDPFRIVIDVTTRPRVTEDRPGADGKRDILRIALDPGHGGADAGAVGPTAPKRSSAPGAWFRTRSKPCSSPSWAG
jgi:N-acetylmuramoyl-L-alanine amidase